MHMCMYIVIYRESKAAEFILPGLRERLLARTWGPELDLWANPDKAEVGYGWELRPARMIVDTGTMDSIVYAPIAQKTCDQHQLLVASGQEGAIVPE